MSNIKELIRQKRIYFDGGMGSMLQKRGLQAGELAEVWNLTHPDIITEVHRAYLEAGSNIITTNTFGVNSLKHENYEELIKAAINCAKEAKFDYPDSFIAFDIGPLGRFLKPIGDLSFDEAVEIFARNIRAISTSDVDLIIIETMTDSLETKAAVLAAKENSNLPIFVTNVYDENAKMLTGASPEVMAAMLEGLGVDAIGVNCSLGPDKMVNVVKRLYSASSLPIIANPNAGMPSFDGNSITYTTDAEKFAEQVSILAKNGANILGGCCGTEPEYIRSTIQKTKEIPLNQIGNNNKTVISSYTHTVTVGDAPILIGERINPTGKPRYKQALIESDLSYVQEQAVLQCDNGAHILDVNVGLPSIDEQEMLKNVVTAIQSVCDLPLSLDSNNPVALEGAMRLYNGKPIINSVNGDDESMSAIFPLIKKYGGCVIALTLDKKGIPQTASERVEIAERIIDKANEYGISAKDIIFDPLALTVATNPDNMDITLEAVRELSKRGYNTSLGISNVSFGMPERDKLNSLFFAKALKSGLSCAIMNPLSEPMMKVYESFIDQTLDDISFDFIDQFSNNHSSTNISDTSLKDMIIKGIIGGIVDKINNLLQSHDPLTIINDEIIPALNEVGDGFEKQTLYLPQLLKSAECAAASFDTLKSKMSVEKSNEKSIIIATVKGDIHDIGKNIVKLMIESYGFTVYDLGKDVSPEQVLDAVKKYNCNIVALSALMTTTLPAMQKTVKLLHEYSPEIKVMVGGAVLTPEYAKSIGADAYGKDAMSAARIVEEFYRVV